MSVPAATPAAFACGDVTTAAAAADREANRRPVSRCFLLMPVVVNEQGKYFVRAEGKCVTCAQQDLEQSITGA